MSEEIKPKLSCKDLLIDLANEYEIISENDIDEFEKIYNKYDDNFLNEKINRCAWWTLNKDGGGLIDKYNNLIKKHEKLICERILKRIKNKKL